MKKNHYTRLPPLVRSLPFFLLASCEILRQAVAATIAPIAALPPMTIPLCINEQCGVLDQNGAILVSPDNDYDNIASAPSHNTFLFAKDGFWNLASANGKRIIKERFSDGELLFLTPGYYGIGHDGKFSVMNAQGDEIQPAKFDTLYLGGNKEFIVYEIDGKLGFLSTTGILITELLFDSASIWTNLAQTGGWLTALRGNEKWIVNINTHEQKKVTFDKISSFADGHMVVAMNDGGQGLADANGNLLTELKYQRLGLPGNGLVAFHEESLSPCGYLDYQGRVAIPATFSSCEVFGQQGALVMTKTSDGTYGNYGKAGLINRSGEWLIQPTYDWAGPAGHSVMGMLRNVPGYNSIAMRQGDYRYGIFNVNKGVVVFQPDYLQIGVLNDNLFVFTKPDMPLKKTTMFGQATQTPPVGVMDAAGKVLIEPGQYIDIRLDATGHYLIAMENTTAQSALALYNLSGKQLVPAKWQELVINEARGVVFAYERMDSDQPGTLKAVYRLDGTPSFQLSRIACGAEQVLNSKGQTLWPANPKAFCPQSTKDVGKKGRKPQKAVR
ncbi:hypothetical protein GQ37_022285 [Janthinobacterium sp. BJB1]|nr:hypothetical protein GQ37_022285 [Janthinobacterium sp. BJB1]